MHVSGACLCGAVTFSAEVESVKTMVCHCADCQVLGSTAFRIGAMVPGDTFKIEGLTHEYRREACAGPRSQVFCPTCATVLYSYTPDSPAPMIVLSIGAVHQRHEIAPQFQLWGSAALPWLPNLPAIPQVTPQEMMRAGQA
jgi:hypothetical protein